MADKNLMALKIEVYPTYEQSKYLSRLFGCGRKVYNMALEAVKKHYEENDEFLPFEEWCHLLHHHWMLDSEMEYLKEHNTRPLKQSLLNLEQAYKNFFENPIHFGLPVFKTKYDKQSIRFPKDGISKKQDFSKKVINIDRNLKKLKFRTSKLYRDYLVNGNYDLRDVTVSRRVDGRYFMSILIDDRSRALTDRRNHIKPDNLIIGLDMGIKDFIVTSQKDVYANLKIVRDAEKKHRRLQRAVSRKVLGSKNRGREQKRLNKFVRRGLDIKENYMHQIINELLDKNQVIVIEDLNLVGMVKNHKLARSIQELSIGRFFNILYYKAARRGNIVIKIDRFFPSSKLCNDCGYKNDNLTLNDREWVCTDCGVIHDRDYNASINIMYEGMCILIEDEKLKNNLLEIINGNKELSTEDVRLYNIIKDILPVRCREVMVIEPYKSNDVMSSALVKTSKA